MKGTKIIGIDLGATNIRGAIITDKSISKITSMRIQTKGTEEQVLEDVYSMINAIIDDEVKAIGIGVPSVVDVKKGIVYDVIHIPSWKEVHLKELLESRYHIPVFVNNDANCFALGEHYFGKGQGVDDMVGLTIGTGLGAGIIIHNQLYAGKNCGAGEFGMVDYLDYNYEYYCSGSFFQNIHGLSGEEVYKKAKNGDVHALALYNEFGIHLGNAIKMIMYTYDPELIILGGSVQWAFEFFENAMWKRIQTFGYSKSIERLQIKTSVLENGGILGAAALYYDAECVSRPHSITEFGLTRSLIPVLADQNETNNKINFRSAQTHNYLNSKSVDMPIYPNNSNTLFKEHVPSTENAIQVKSNSAQNEGHNFYNKF